MQLAPLGQTFVSAPAAVTSDSSSRGQRRAKAPSPDARWCDVRDIEERGVVRRLSEAGKHWERPVGTKSSTSSLSLSAAELGR